MWKPFLIIFLINQCFLDKISDKRQNKSMSDWKRIQTKDTNFWYKLWQQLNVWPFGHDLHIAVHKKEFLSDVSTGRQSESL